MPREREKERLVIAGYRYEADPNTSGILFDMQTLAADGWIEVDARLPGRGGG